MIVYDPKKMLNKIAPKKLVKKLITQNAGLNKSALSFVSKTDFLSKASIQRVALKTTKGYKERIKKDPSLKKELKKDPAQLIQRVQNEVVLQISEAIREKYRGEFYIWLPTDASEPRPEHQLNYGKKFQIGDGEQPGDLPGCLCGMQILVEEKQLEL